MYLENVDDINVEIEHVATIGLDIKESGPPGPQGPAGENGVDGKDGYTPIRGTDYWTPTDISTIERYCNNYIDSQLGTINEQLASLTEVK